MKTALVFALCLNILVNPVSSSCWQVYKETQGGTVFSSRLWERTERPLEGTITITADKKPERSKDCYFLLKFFMSSKSLDIHFKHSEIKLEQGRQKIAYNLKGHQDSTLYLQLTDRIVAQSFQNSSQVASRSISIPWETVTNIVSHSRFISTEPCITLRTISACPHLTEHPGVVKRVVELGQKFRMACNTSAPPPLEVTWGHTGMNKIGQNFSDRQHVETFLGISETEISSFLNVDNFTQRDIGYYSCTFTSGLVRNILRGQTFLVYDRPRITAEPTHFVYNTSDPVKIAWKLVRWADPFEDVEFSVEIEKVLDPSITSHLHRATFVATIPPNATTTVVISCSGSVLYNRTFTVQVQESGRGKLVFFVISSAAILILAVIIMLLAILLKHKRGLRTLDIIPNATDGQQETPEP